MVVPHPIDTCIATLTDLHTGERFADEHTDVEIIEEAAHFYRYRIRRTVKAENKSTSATVIGTLQYDDNFHTTTIAGYMRQNTTTMGIVVAIIALILLASVLVYGVSLIFALLCLLASVPWAIISIDFAEAQRAINLLHWVEAQVSHLAEPL